MVTSVPSSIIPIFQIKVTLLGVEPAVWRRLLVPADITLGELHFVVNEAMGWDCSHPHSFSVGSRTWGDPELDPNSELKYESESEAVLKSLVGEGETLAYVYDFGSGWEHAVHVEKQVPFDNRTAYPLCVGGARACPPEDCHGPVGYQSFLDAMSNPKHNEHDEMLEWIGGFFDPEGFDANRTNMAIRQMYECPDCEGCNGESCDCGHHEGSHGHSQPN